MSLTMSSQTSLSKGAAVKSKKSSFAALVLGSIGVVYGDIGTSPLYALKEAVRSAIDICHIDGPTR